MRLDALSLKQSVLSDLWFQAKFYADYRGSFDLARLGSLENVA